MRKIVLRTFVVVLAATLLAAGTAQAIKLRAGNILVVADGGFSPTKLPRDTFAPIKLRGHAKISTTDDALPEILKTITIWFDKHGKVETRGLPVCTPAKLAATTTKTARKLCPGAIVGTGYGEAVINLPEQAPIEAGSPITIFNGAKKDGNATVLAHAHLTVPGPVTFIVPIVIERINGGRYGFKTVAEIPRISGGYGTPTYGRLSIGREWNYKGKRLSYANASCNGGRLQAKGMFNFKNGAVLQGTLARPCQVR